VIEHGEQQRLRRDIQWNLLPVVLLGVVGLGMNFGIGKIWGAAALGVFSLVTISFFAFAVLGACGLQYAVLRAVAEAEGDRLRIAAIVVGALIPTFALAAVSTAAYLALRGTFDDLQGPAVAEGMLWVAPGLFCFAINKVLLGVVNGLRRMRAFAIYTSLRYVLIAIALVLAYAWKLEGAHLPVIWTFAEGVLFLVLIVELFATVEVSRGKGWRIEARRHLEFGVRGVGATLASEVNSKLDVWMLGSVLPHGSPMVGIYSLGAQIFEGVTQLAVVVQNNVNPVIARELALGHKSTVEELARRTRRWFVPAIIAACALGAVLYPVVIPWLVGDLSFDAGSWPFAILMLGIALASPYLPFIQLLLMADKPGWHTAYVIGVLAVSAVGTLALIPVWGMQGAAISAAGSLVASAVLLRVITRARVGLRL
jgi:O-antigen/teichoic acid export membrane protein